METKFCKSEEEFISEIRRLLSASHDYNTSAEAMAEAASLAFNYVAAELGCTGFQAGWAQMRFLQDQRNMERFTVINFDDMLYPQYDVENKLKEQMNSSELKLWLKEKAQKNIDALDVDQTISMKVYEHWKRLAAYNE